MAGTLYESRDRAHDRVRHPWPSSHHALVMSLSNPGRQVPVADRQVGAWGGGRCQAGDQGGRPAKQLKQLDHNKEAPPCTRQLASGATARSAAARGAPAAARGGTSSRGDVWPAGALTQPGGVSACPRTACAQLSQQEPAGRFPGGHTTDHAMLRSRAPIPLARAHWDTLREQTHSR